MTTANSPASKEVVTAALLVIGSRILSGRTKDQNIGYIAQYLTALGIDLKEVRSPANGRPGSSPPRNTASISRMALEIRKGP